MKRLKFTEAQIAFVLKQAEDGKPAGEICRKTGISEATFYYWRKKYAGLMPSEIKRLKQLEEENSNGVPPAPQSAPNRLGRDPRIAIRARGVSTAALRGRTHDRT